jgi:transcriptional regulator with XRE-family HTH domain
MPDNQPQKISQRLKQVRKTLGMSQKEFANTANILQSQVSEIENEKKNITSAIYLRLEDTFGINRKWLETGEEPMMLNKEPVKYGNAKDLGRIDLETDQDTKFIDLGDGKYLMIVPLVPEFAHAGYLSNFKDSEFLEELPKHTIIVDKHHRGHYRAFEIVGESMDNNSRESITDGSIATGREINRDHWRSKFHTHRSKDFIFVSKTEGIVAKRIIGQDIENGVLILHSLNEDKELYPDFSVSLDDIEQIFSIVQVTQKRYA